LKILIFQTAFFVKFFRPSVSLQDGQAKRKNRHDKYNKNHRIKSLCGGCYEQQKENHLQACLLAVWQSAQFDEVSRARRRVSLVQKTRARMDETNETSGE